MAPNADYMVSSRTRSVSGAIHVDGGKLALVQFLRMFST
jgi:hypothetical protein